MGTRGRDVTCHRSLLKLYTSTMAFDIYCQLWEVKGPVCLIQVLLKRFWPVFLGRSLFLLLTISRIMEIQRNQCDFLVPKHNWEKTTKIKLPRQDEDTRCHSDIGGCQPFEYHAYLTLYQYVLKDGKSDTQNSFFNRFSKKTDCCVLFNNETEERGTA